MKLVVATGHFPVSADIESNCRYVLKQMKAAKEQGADVMHFCESALSGYPGVDFKSFRAFDWELLEGCTEKIMQRAGELRLWVLLGSSHRLSGRHKPHNSVYLIDYQGKLVDRYDKMFCAGDRSGKTFELAHFTPGDHFTQFTIKGVKCGVLICHDYRYPELYRQYKRHGVQLVFHSFYAGNVPPKRWKEMQNEVGKDFFNCNTGTTLPELTMPATMQAMASNSYVWISCSNTSARESCLPSFFVRPDGVVTGRLRRHVAGVLISTLDTSKKFYDSSAAWRDRAIKGVYHSGNLVKDKRSADRRSL